MAASVARRRRSAYAAAVAAKQRRQKIFLSVLLAGMLALLAWEAPGVLHHLNGGGSSVGAPVAVSTPPAHVRSLPKAFRGPAGDPFAARVLIDGDSRVAVHSGADPFAAPSSSSSSSSSASAPTAAQPLPEQTIVIGKPSGHGATRGWIVILASIPTGNGRAYASAVSFANSARQNGVGSVSVLKSSNHRPLRGGYWVVYTGPVQTLNAVTGLASNVHAKGYGTAYIRQLVIYR